MAPQKKKKAFVVCCSARARVRVWKETEKALCSTRQNPIYSLYTTLIHLLRSSALCITLREEREREGGWKGGGCSSKETPMRDREILMTPAQTKERASERGFFFSSFSDRVSLRRRRSGSQLSSGLQQGQTGWERDYHLNISKRHSVGSCSKKLGHTHTYRRHSMQYHIKTQPA